MMLPWRPIQTQLAKRMLGGYLPEIGSVEKLKKDTLVSHVIGSSNDKRNHLGRYKKAVNKPELAPRCAKRMCSKPASLGGHFAEFADLEEEEKETASPTFTSLWLASIWWEAGYQQGRGESKYPSCNEIRMAMKAKKTFEDYQLPDCDASGLWTPLQCSDKNCWCVFVDSGYRIQRVPFGEVDSMLICPKLYLFGTDPCNVAQTPLFTCRNVRSSKQKWIYNSISKKCEVQESCTGFASAQECSNTCDPVPMSLCTMPLNRGNCSSEPLNPLIAPSAEDELSKLTQERYYFHQGKNACVKFDSGNCGGNSNNFKSSLECLGTCIKDTTVTVQARIGQQLVSLQLPAWLVIELDLSETEARDIPPELLPMVFQYARQPFLSAPQQAGPSNSGEMEVVGMRLLGSQQGISARTADRDSLMDMREKPARCMAKTMPGECRAYVPAWYYDKEEDACKVFVWGGCWGRLDREMQNNFMDKTTCAETCSSIDRSRNPSDFRDFLLRGDDESLAQINQPQMNVGVPPMAIPYEMVGEQRAQLENLMMLG
ncbi:Oidioi.mRNA.OKI2018_I69.XSR.g14743.t1.cds [Oikopleura dioica]|uniref:Oidioi.mRNA.OKI2018_I69.XSR.g14743.t1.cds n=1 Tax=Oikopleura dioica TaxID=34765 RepID=A0ABN7SEQ1_OIKDI|nr:Oidioi.mRNA.OKI2018_I69.XSR.g14743.t1.cds [Oikopleura dioica]